MTYEHFQEKVETNSQTIMALLLCNGESSVSINMYIIKYLVTFMPRVEDHFMRKLDDVCNQIVMMKANDDNRHTIPDLSWAHKLLLSDVLQMRINGLETSETLFDPPLKKTDEYFIWWIKYIHGTGRHYCPTEKQLLERILMERIHRDCECMNFYLKCSNYWKYTPGLIL